jgi:N-methylhydantoinase A
VVPPHPGLCSAFGCAITEARVDRAQTHHARSDLADPARLGATQRILEERAVTDLRRSVAVEQPVLRRSADMRYAGQNYELETPLPAGDLEETFDELLAAFEREHERQYGFRLDGEVIEIVNLRVTAVRPEPPPAIAAPAPTGAPEPIEVRPVWFDADGPVECPIFRRDALSGGARLDGPAVIEEVDSTTLVDPGDRLEVHPGGSLVVTIGEGA